MIAPMVIISKPIDDLRASPDNPRIISDYAVAAVVASLKRFGFRQPIIIDNKGVIVAGHVRHIAAKQVGMSEVPCVLVGSLTTKQVMELRIVDNRTGELSEWDTDALAKELDDLDLAGFFDFIQPPKSTNTIVRLYTAKFSVDKERMDAWHKKFRHEFPEPDDAVAELKRRIGL